MHRMMKWLLLTFLWSAFFATGAHGKSITAADCQQASVAAAVSQASSGDTVIIPACAQTNWTTTLTVSKCINIQGAGQGVTILGDNVTKNGSDTSQLMTFNVGCGGGSLSLHDLTIVGVAPDSSVFNKGHIRILGSAGSFRVHHITVQSPTTSFATTNYVGVGLFDHLTVACVAPQLGAINMKSSSWGGSNYGDGSWADPTPMPGSANMIFIEDNTWTCGNSQFVSNPVDGDAGARWAVRFNTFLGGNVASHGTDSSQRERSARWQEIYQNTFTFYAAQAVDFVSWIRGGTGIEWGNTVISPGGLNSMQKGTNLRDTGSFTPWGQCNGSSVFDQNSTGTGYRCVDQPGAGTSNNLNGAATPPAQWVGNINDPMYIFLNTLGGSPRNNVAGSTNVTNNRDFYTQTSSFNGTAGVGVGTFAQRPATCTAGVAYWATDQGFWNTKTPTTPAGQLYKCTSANTWTLWYTPHNYPHPLQSGSGTPPTPPTGLADVVN